MSNVRYIDVNATNSQKNETNNRWTYKVNDGLYLPTGTQVEVANSLVNLPGIVGSSIEIEKDIEETICFQYYQVDTSYQTPVAKIAVPGDDTLAYTALLNVQAEINPGDLTDSAYINQAAEDGYFRDYWGYSECVMPLQTVAKVDTTLLPDAPIVVPFCGQAKIKVNKGIYSITELSELITDQINRKVNLDDPSFTYVNEKKDEFLEDANLGPFNGSVVNNTTNRLGRVETPLFWDAYQKNHSYKVQADPTQDPLDPNNLSFVGRQGALRSDESEIPTIVATLPQEARAIMDKIKNPDNYKNEVPDDLDPNLIWKITGGTNRVYAKGYQQQNGLPIKYGYDFTPAQQTNLMDGTTYNLFDNNAMAVGTTGFKISYSTDKAGFNINYCHQPRQIPTHDIRGNALSNPGQEAVYVKRVPASNEIFDAFPPSTADPDAIKPYPNLGTLPTTQEINTLRNTCNVPVSRSSGIMIYNFGFQTAKSLATNTTVKNYSSDIQEYHTFEDFFNNQEEARKAWEQTIWYRLGFSYDQLQNPNNFETQVFYDRDPVKNYGFTTNAEVDPSILPFQSTLYNAYNITAANPDKDRAFGLPAIPSIQLFNLLDSNVPSQAYNNNLKASNKPSVAPFEGSFYTMAIMIPIQTTSEGLTAKNLPTLSTNGYMLVLSDIVDQNDFAGDQSELGIIDMVSKSSLSNQDFISDRQVLTHVLSNPKSINYININIVNPDLTDVSLEPNSTILLKLTFPRPKNTILIQNTEDNIADNIITQQTQQEFMEEMKASGMPTGSTSGGGDQPPDPQGGGGKVKRTAQRVREVKEPEKEKPEEEGGEGEEEEERVEVKAGGGRRETSELRGGEREEPREFQSIPALRGRKTGKVVIPAREVPVRDLRRDPPRFQHPDSEQYKRERMRVAELLDKGKITRSEAMVRLEQIRRRHQPGEQPRSLRPIGASASGVRERLARTAHGRDALDRQRQQQAQQRAQESSKQ